MSCSVSPIRYLILFDVLFKDGVIALLQHLTVAIIVAVISRESNVSASSRSQSRSAVNQSLILSVFTSVYSPSSISVAVSTLDNCRRSDVMETIRG
jgi:hypothetical protein